MYAHSKNGGSLTSNCVYRDIFLINKGIHEVKTSRYHMPSFLNVMTSSGPFIVYSSVILIFIPKFVMIEGKTKTGKVK